MNRLIVGALLLPYALSAQQPATEPLKPVDATLASGFSIARLTMHELRDGRVIISDARDNRLVVANFATGKIEPVPNVGAMPLLPLAGDTSVLMGLDGRWVFLEGARPIGMLTRDNPVVAVVEYAAGADSFGNLLADKDEKPSHSDSAVLVLVARATAEQTIVGRLWQPSRGVVGAPRPLFMAYEQGFLALDGWIAVLRIAPYRIDWRSPDGRWTLGRPIPVPPVPMDDREKKAYMVSHAAGGAPARPETIANWPDVVPPWSAGRPPIASVDGMLLVARTPTADFPGMRYDVINRRGELERQVLMPANESIMGFGAKSVYVGVMDKNGVQHVQRHPWP